MSDLPKAVQAQLDAAEALQAQLVNPAPVEGNPEVAPVTEAQATQPVETVVQETRVAEPNPDNNWEQRFRVIEGKYRAEIPRLHDQNRELSERLEQALKALEEKAQTPVEEKKLVTDADVESFGADMVDMVRRAAREEFDALAKKFAAELDKRFGAVAAKVEQTEQVVVKSAKDKFWDAVDAKHADFAAVNSDPRWFAFLDTRIPGSRLTRRTLAENAIAELDAEALVEQINLFKESLPKAEPQQPAKQKPSLNSQVAPNTSGASNPSPDPVGKIWTGAEYAAALDHRNMQRMSRADYDALVAEAETAFAEGRVRF